MNEGTYFHGVLDIECVDTWSREDGENLLEYSNDQWYVLFWEATQSNVTFIMKSSSIQIAICSRLGENVPKL